MILDISNKQRQKKIAGPVQTLYCTVHLNILFEDLASSWNDFLRIEQSWNFKVAEEELKHKTDPQKQHCKNTAAVKSIKRTEYLKNENNANI